MKAEDDRVYKLSEHEQKKAGNFQILNPHEFLNDLGLEAGTAKKRMWLQAMYFEPGTKTATLLKILRKSTNKQVNKKVHMDWFGYRSSGTDDNNKRQMFLELQ